MPPSVGHEGTPNGFTTEMTQIIFCGLRSRQISTRLNSDGRFRTEVSNRFPPSPSSNHRMREEFLEERGSVPPVEAGDHGGSIPGSTEAVPAGRQPTEPLYVGFSFHICPSVGLPGVGGKLCSYEQKRQRCRSFHPNPSEEANKLMSQNVRV